MERHYAFIRESLERHVADRILPCYDSFDAAHRRDHAETVISQAMDLYLQAPEEIRDRLDPELLYAAAAYHDLGLVNGRENHHLDSGKIIREDSALMEWFSHDDIMTIAMAAEDHRASGKTEPRSMYGKIIAEADRVIDPETIIIRTLQYGQAHYPELGREAQLLRAEEHLKVKYGYGGYLRLWIPWSSNAARLESLREIIADPQRLSEMLIRLYYRM